MKISTADGLVADLDETHWESHIASRHPELKGNWDQVLETLRFPEGVYRSKRDRGTRIYARAFTGIVISGAVFDRMTLLVYVREENGFVVTAHFAAAQWRSLGEQIWPS